MTHIVVDQAESKAPVHDGQAPLWGESTVSKHAVMGAISDKTNTFYIYIFETEINTLKQLLCSGAELKIETIA